MLRALPIVGIVAPCVGAWIENAAMRGHVRGRPSVAPCVGAWIETFGRLKDADPADGRTLRGCVD